LTAQRQVELVCTTTCWLPTLVSEVTESPDAAPEVTAGVDPAAAPDFTAKI
jgi:hypothetical protein